VSEVPAHFMGDSNGRSDVFALEKQKPQGVVKNT
jgi:hypothetical protein